MTVLSFIDNEMTQTLSLNLKDEDQETLQRGPVALQRKETRKTGSGEIIILPGQLERLTAQQNSHAHR